MSNTTSARHIEGCWYVLLFGTCSPMILAPGMLSPLATSAIRRRLPPPVGPEDTPPAADRGVAAELLMKSAVIVFADRSWLWSGRDVWSPLVAELWSRGCRRCCCTSSVPPPPVPVPAEAPWALWNVVTKLSGADSSLLISVFELLG